MGKGFLMTLTFNENTAFDLFQGTLDLVLESDNSQDLCRRVVHSDLFNEMARGACVYLLNTRSNLVEHASYGEPFVSDKPELSVWEENPASKAVRTKSTVFQQGREESSTLGTLALPLVQGKAPIGCFVVVLSPECTENPLPLEISEALEKLGGHFVASKGGLNGQRSVASREGSVEDLTTRQVKILGFMSDGMTNAEISSQVLLSESTVRQETIKIYRALQVAGRQEAVAKARSLGLLPQFKL